MDTERAARFLTALAETVAYVPWYISYSILSIQLAAILVWYGAFKPQWLSRRPGAALGAIYTFSPFYLFILGVALYRTLYPLGLHDMPYVAYFGVLVLICASVLSFGIWLVTEKNPPRRFIPKWAREGATAYKRT